MMNHSEETVERVRQEHIHVFRQLGKDMMTSGLEPETLPKLMENELDIARVANRLNQGPQLLESLRNCLRFAVAAAHCESQSEGWVLINIESLGESTCQLGKTAWSIPLWLDATLVAIILRDKAAISALANKTLLERLFKFAQSSKQVVGRESFWLPYGEALIALLNGDPQALSYIETALHQLKLCRSYVDPACLLSVDQPLLELMASLTFGDVVQWQRKFEKSLDSYQQYYAREENQFLLQGLFPIGLTALATLAKDKGFIHKTPIKLIPSDLSQAKQTAGNLSYCYPLKSILTANEAHWFFDLQGFPRNGRQHTLIEKNQHLIARYEVTGAPTIPHARAEFVLLDDPLDRDAQLRQTAFPLALDAGELLFLAQSFADHKEGTRALLVDAVSCVNAVIARIASGEDAVAPASIISREGKAIYAAEPGRFRRDRLLAYRDALQLQINQADKPSDTDAIHQEVSHIAIDAIRYQVEPIIKAFAGDTSRQYLQTLKPEDSDYEKVFTGEAVELARKAYTELWNKGFSVQYPTSIQSELCTYVAPAGLLGQENPLSRDFPQGYRAIAGWLNPHRVWVAWCYRNPTSTAGLNYDGLVYIDDHWVWLPKPYRVLAPLGVRRV